MRVFKLVALIAIFVSGAMMNTAAEVPPFISYQGFVTDNLGDPANGTYLMHFAIFPIPDTLPGSELWYEDHYVEVTDGSFSTYLGTISPLPPSIFSTGPTYLGIKLDSAWVHQDGRRDTGEAVADK